MSFKIWYKEDEPFFDGEIEGEGQAVLINIDSEGCAWCVKEEQLIMVQFQRITKIELQKETP